MKYFTLIKFQLLALLTLMSQLNAGMLVEHYNDIHGNEVTHLTNHASYPDSPSEEYELHAYQKNIGSFYGLSATGNLVIPTSGNYHFYISGDDQTHLYMEVDNGVFDQIATTVKHTSFMEFEKRADQKSEPIFLESGDEITLRVLQKEHWGGDHFSIAWNYETSSGHFENRPFVIPANTFTPYKAHWGGFAENLTDSNIV